MKEKANVGLLLASLILLILNTYRLDFTDLSWEVNRNGYMNIISNILLVLLFSINLRKILKKED